VSGLPASLTASPRLLDGPALQRTLTRLAHEIVERHPGAAGGTVLAGIRTRGVPLATRLAAELGALGSGRPAVVDLDPRAYRDDVPSSGAIRGPALRAVDDGEVATVAGAAVIVVDDVLFTGRTVRAAIDALIAAGRPAVIEVLVLIDRGHRELPLRATYVGKNVPTRVHDRVAVRLREVDGVDGAWLLRGVRV
jgi:pyrimidine operon attenuation protein/uracil phosphoribosyltransferase